MTTTHQPIAIVGAGLGGLVLARVLHLGGVEAAVYDLDASPASRPQGGMLDMHVESGQAALRAAGLHEEFLAAIHAGGEAMRILDKHGTVRMEESDDGGTDGRPEVSRHDLRDMLLASLPEGTIRWGAKVTAARPLTGGGHEVTSPPARPSRPTCSSAPTAPGPRSARCSPTPAPPTPVSRSSRRTWTTRTPFTRRVPKSSAADRCSRSGTRRASSPTARATAACTSTAR